MDALVDQGRAGPAQVRRCRPKLERLIEGARAELKQRGMKDVEKAPIPDDLFRPQAERRVRLGLVVAELVRANQLHATPEQMQAPTSMIWPLQLREARRRGALVLQSDNRRMAEVEAIVIENNVDRFRAGQGQGHRQSRLVRRTDGQPGLNARSAMTVIRTE
jgi:trigger factor